MSNRLARIQKRKVFWILKNTDTVGGNGYDYIAGYYLNELKAKEDAYGAYVMGSDCPIKSDILNVVITEKDEFYILGKSVDTNEPEIKESENLMAARAAIANLSPEDKELLASSL